MLLFFDTETTGMVDHHAPAKDQGQPGVVQLAALLTGDDGDERAHINLIVQPGVPISPGAARVHGITDKMAANWGVQPQTAFSVFYEMALRADLLIAHNIDFDIKVMMAAGYRASRAEDAETLGKMPSYCTMKTATDVVQMPGHRRGIYKWPKLEECISHFFDEKLAGAHDALVDIRACKRVFFALRGAEQSA